MARPKPLTEITEALDYHGPQTFGEVGYGPEHAGERNRLRAYWAAKALKAYGNEVGFDVVETIISDLIADLRHFAAVCKTEDGKPIDTYVFDALEASARDRWHEEAILLED